MQITKVKQAQLKEELKELKARRPKLAEALATARDFGDISENQEYTDARQEQNTVESRILKIENILQVAKIIKEGNKSKVELGASLVVKCKGKKSNFLMVSEIEADPLLGKISTKSPLGKALHGHKIGDEVEFKTPKGLAKYTILEIK
ncbi:transcription elongation factor GreA [Candidatus Saccharibacteria bacterium]|nr:transcription elongation factor GreA [Candidatus Saccharibacteria bacterium]